MQHAQLIALASTLVQFSAAFLALRLIPLTRSKIAWTCISLAFILQGARRALFLAEGGAPLNEWTSLTNESVGLVVSILLLAGVAWISPLFRALRESEERFRTVADFTHDMEYWRLPDGRMEYVSPACRRVCGRGAEEFLAHPDLMLEMVHPDDRDAFAEHMRRDDTMRNEDGGMELRILMPDGSVRWLAHCCRPVFGKDGTYLGRRGTNRDITARKVAEELRADVERIMRHDLKSPLLGIIGIPQALLEDSDLPAHLRRPLQLLERSGRDMLDLVESSLAVNRLERGGTLRDHEEVDLVQLAHAVFASLAQLAKAYGVRLELLIGGAPEKEHSEVLYCGERLLLRTMIANLAKNAIEASRKGDSVTLDIRAGQETLIHVHNTGLVPEGIRTTIFDKYVSAGKSGGTGLGTHSARLAARAHGGDITFRSAFGEGTTFTVRLPRTSPEHPTQ